MGKKVTDHRIPSKRHAKLHSLLKEAAAIDEELNDIERAIIIEGVRTGAITPGWAEKLLKPVQTPRRKGGGANPKLKPADIEKGIARCRRLLNEFSGWADARDALAKRVLELEQFGVSWKTVRRRIVDAYFGQNMTE